MAEIIYDTRALAVGLDSWTGSMTVDGYGPTFTSTGIHTAIELALQLRGMGTISVDANFALSIADSYVTFSNPSEVAFTLAFSGNTGTRLGFTSASYSGQYSYTGDVKATGLWSAGYDDHCLRIDEARVMVTGRGSASSAGSGWATDTPGKRLGSVSIRQTVSRSEAERLAGILALQAESDPFIEVIDAEGAYWRGWPDRYRVTPAGGVSQVYRVELEGVRQR